MDMGRQVTKLERFVWNFATFARLPFGKFWVAFHSLTFQLKCLDFQSNQYKKLTLVLSHLRNGLWEC